MNLFSKRLSYLWGFLLIAIMMGIAFYLQFVKGIAPCPLCILQRIVAAFLGVVFFFGAVLSWSKWGDFFLGLFSFFISILGVLLSGRQVWIQHLPPDKTADCGVSLQYMLQMLPLDEVFRKVLQGTAECSQLEWSLFGFSLAEWSLFWFVVFAVFSIWQVLRRSS